MYLTLPVKHYFDSGGSAGEDVAFPTSYIPGVKIEIAVQRITLP